MQNGQYTDFYSTNMNKGISIIVCCHNSSQRLPVTLSYLSKQQYDAKTNVEILVVDNASTDNTGSVAQEIWRSLSSETPLRVVNEPTPGLSYARACGIKNSNYDLLLFCDDDNWLAENYLQTAVEYMNAHQDVAVLGGKGIPVFEKEEPFWFKDFALCYACGAPALNEGDITGFAFAYGAGSVMRKSFHVEMEKAGLSNQLTDRKGNELSSGGDVELCLQAALLGYKVHYISALNFKHYMPAGRMKWDYIIRLAPAMGKATAITEVYNTVIQARENSVTAFGKFLWLKNFIKSLKDIILALLPNVIRDFIGGKREGSGALFVLLLRWSKAKEYLRLGNRYDDLHYKLLLVKTSRTLTN